MLSLEYKSARKWAMPFYTQILRLHANYAYAIIPLYCPSVEKN